MKHKREGPKKITGIHAVASVLHKTTKFGDYQTFWMLCSGVLSEFEHYYFPFILICNQNIVVTSYLPSPPPNHNPLHKTRPLQNSFPHSILHPLPLLVLRLSVYPSLLHTLLWKIPLPWHHCKPNYLKENHRICFNYHQIHYLKLKNPIKNAYSMKPTRGYLRIIICHEFPATYNIN